MAEREKPKPIGRDVDLTVKVNADYLRSGEHTLVVPLPPTIVELMGRVIVAWGAFDTRMNNFIDFLLKVYPDHKVPKRWRTQGYGLRKPIFADLIERYTKKHFPAETETFQKIITAADGVVWQRNAIAHGYVKGRSVVDGSAATGANVVWYVVGFHNGVETIVDLDESALDKLAHDAAHLGGNLMATLHKMGGHLLTDSPEIVLADSDFLKDQQSGTFQPLIVSKIST